MKLWKWPWGGYQSGHWRRLSSSLATEWVDVMKSICSTSHVGDRKMRRACGGAPRAAPRSVTVTASIGSKTDVLLYVANELTCQSETILRSYRQEMVEPREKKAKWPPAIGWLASIFSSTTSFHWRPRKFGTEYREFMAYFTICDDDKYFFLIRAHTQVLIQPHAAGKQNTQKRVPGGLFVIINYPVLFVCGLMTLFTWQVKQQVIPTPAPPNGWPLNPPILAAFKRGNVALHLNNWI